MYNLGNLKTENVQSGVWFDKSKQILNKMGSGPGSPFRLADKAPWTSWMFNFGGFTDSPHPHKQETRGLITIQATSFFPWWLRLFFQENFEAKWDFEKSKALWNVLHIWNGSRPCSIFYMLVNPNYPKILQNPPPGFGCFWWIQYSTV